MRVVSTIGEQAIERWRVARNITAVIVGVFSLALRPRYWPRTVRDVLARQVLFTGVEALALTTLIALLAGVSVVAQVQLWLNRFGQSAMLGSILVAAIVREVGPLLVNFLVIGRSGTAIATEMAYMQVRREIDVLDAQGVDPMVYIVMPRVVGVALAVFSLTILFILVSFLSGYLVAVFLGATPGDPSFFARNVLGAVTPAVLWNVPIKTILPGLLIGSTCCIEGLSVRGSVTEVPQAATRAVVRSIAGVLLIAATSTILSYV